MKTLTSFFCLFWAFFAIHDLSAQVGDLLQDQAFFETQSRLYQKWLDKSGLGESLQVHELNIENDRVSLYLSFRYTKLDTIVNAWDKLEKIYETEGGVSLEQSLYYKWVNLIEVRQSLVNIQIYDTYDLRREPLFSRIMYYENGKMQVDKDDPRSEIATITLRPPNQSDKKHAAQLDFQSRMGQEVIFDQIIRFVEEKYQKTNCEGRNPEVKVLDNDEILRFEVMDLCREVLIDEAQPTVCGILRSLGYSCDWVKRELLIFMVSYRTDGEAIKIRIELDGKYGSGMYERVRRGGYLSMEIDFDEYLERYASLFKEDLRRYLGK